MNTKETAGLVFGITLIILAGCGDAEESTVNTAPEPGTSTSEQPATAPSTPAARAAGTPWIVPAGWTQELQQRPMRAATFHTGKGEAAIEVAVSQFPGDVGGLLANVNRWRKQIGLEPISETELPTIIQPFENPGFKGYTMRLEGTTQHMLAAAITEQQADRTWFVKAVCSPAQADAHEATVEAFARSFGAPDNAAR